MWGALFLAFDLQYISGEICEVHYSYLFTCSTSVGRSVGCIIPSFLLAVHQWGDLWGALFLAFYLQYISWEICWVYYSLFLLAVQQWGDLRGALFLAFYLQYISGEICGVHYS